MQGVGIGVLGVAIALTAAYLVLAVTLRRKAKRSPEAHEGRRPTSGGRPT